jgi:hypothetical protein
MRNEDEIRACLKSKHNLSTLGLDGIGYLHLKFGGDPMIKFLSLIFGDCVAERKVPQTWKSSRTVLLYKKGAEMEMKNWRPISITCCVYRLFTAMMTKWVQDEHSTNKLQIFSRSQKGFVQGQAGCMEHAVLTREMISHATLHHQNLYMVQIDFSNAFGSVPHELILYNMYSMGLSFATVELVRDIYTDNRSKITLTGGETESIPWQSGTVQGCPLSPTVFNICLEGLLRRLEKADMKEFLYGIPMQDGTTIKINAAAYADDLILYADAHEHMEIMLTLLGQFCTYAKMKVNAEKCVSISQVWNGAKADKDPDPFYIFTEKGVEEIPMEIVSIYLGMPIGFNKFENKKHGEEVLASMMEDVRNIGRSRLKIVQKMHALKTFVFPRIDYRMM